MIEFTIFVKTPDIWEFSYSLRSGIIFFLDNDTTGLNLLIFWFGIY